MPLTEDELKIIASNVAPFANAKGRTTHCQSDLYGRIIRMSPLQGAGWQLFLTMKIVLGSSGRLGQPGAPRRTRWLEGLDEVRTSLLSR